MKHSQRWSRTKPCERFFVKYEKVNAGTFFQVGLIESKLAYWSDLCEENSTMHGFYSSKADENFGSCVYKSNKNEGVVVTGVFASVKGGKDNYLWKDKIYVGPVTKFQYRLNDGDYFWI